MITYPIKLPYLYSNSNGTVSEQVQLELEEPLQKELISKIDYPDENELKQIAKKGLLLGVDWERMDYAILPWDLARRHCLLLGKTGAGKTFFELSLLSNWLIEMYYYFDGDVEKALMEKDRFPSTIIIDNLGNFALFGRFVWTKFLKTFKHLDVKGISYFAKHIVTHLSTARERFEWQTKHFIKLSIKTPTQLLESINELTGGIITDEAKRKIFELIKDHIDASQPLFLNEEFDLRSFFYILEDYIRNVGMSDASLRQVYDVLGLLFQEYGRETFRIPELRTYSNMIVSDASKSFERWIFHYSLLEYFYEKVKNKLHRKNVRVFIDEYSDITDDVKLITLGKSLIEKREGKFATKVRVFIMKLLREGRNYGYSTFISTQSPYQLLQTEGRRFGNISTKFWGYLRADIKKLEKNRREDISDALGYILNEAQSGWISRPRSGRFIIESESKKLNFVKLQIFPPLFAQANEEILAKILAKQKQK